MKTPRLIAASAAVALIAGSLLAVGTGVLSASAHDASLSASVKCQTDGSALVTYTLTNDYNLVETVIGSSNPAVAPVNSTVPATNGGANTSITFTETVAAPAANKTGSLTTYSRWSDGFPTDSRAGLARTANYSVPANCLIPDSPTASYKLNVAQGDCTAAGSASVTELNHATLGAALDTSVGTHTATINADAGFTFSDGTKVQTPSYTVQPKVHNASCVAAQQCTALGTAVHESDDNAAVLTPGGWDIRSKADGKATDVIFPASGNLQGLTNFKWTATDTVGNGIFVRFIVDLAADGGSSYNSLSITDTTVTQASIANVGSKSVFLGKTVAQIADLYPEAVYHYVSFQTGSSYAEGDGAVLTGITDGDCSKGFVQVQPAPVYSHTTVTGEVVCAKGNVGGGSFTTTVTYYTDEATFVNGVWGKATPRGTVVDREAHTGGNPVVTPTKVGTDVCPISITTAVVFPTQTDLCGTSQDVRQDAVSTDAYTITTTVNADGSADYSATANQGYRFAEGVTTTAHLDALTNVACPLGLPPQTVDRLATTGVPIWLTLTAALSLLALGAVAYKNRRREGAHRA